MPMYSFHIRIPIAEVVTEEEVLAIMIKDQLLLELRDLTQSNPFTLTHSLSQTRHFFL